MPSPSSSPDLDAEYSPSRRAPAFRSILAEYRRSSDEAKRALRCELNLRYGPCAGQVLHHFPPRAAPSPLLVFVHGGHWQESSIDDACFAARSLVARGAGYVAVGYELAPRGRLDSMVASVARALEWVVANTDRLGTTPHMVHAAGSSAGAHLLAMALGSGPSAAGAEVAGLTLMSGVYDLGLIRLTYVNEALGLDEEAARRNSPVRFLPLRSAQVIVARGEHETDEYGRQHDLLVGELERAAGRPGSGPGNGSGPVRSLVCRGRNHFDLPLHLGDPHDELGRAVLAQMGLAVSGG